MCYPGILLMLTVFAVGRPGQVYCTGNRELG
jgi:hypothetical protein